MVARRHAHRIRRVDNVNGHNPGSKLQTVDVTTKDVVTVLSTSGANYVDGPRWSRDGKSLVVQITRFIDDGNDTDQTIGRAIAVVDLTASKPQLTIIRPFTSYASYPDWDPRPTASSSPRVDTTRSTPPRHLRTSSPSAPTAAESRS